MDILDISVFKYENIFVQTVKNYFSHYLKLNETLPFIYNYFNNLVGYEKEPVLRDVNYFSPPTPSAVCADDL